MPNDTDHKIRVVAEKFMGWKPGMMCDERDRDEYNYCRGCHTWGQGLEVHEIPPPNLLAPAGAWALQVALLRNGIDCHQEFNKNTRRFYVVLSPSDHDFDAYADSAELASLDAAYQLATQGATMSAADLKKLIVAYPRTGDLLSSCGDLYDSDEEYVLALAAKLYVENEQARELLQRIPHGDCLAFETDPNCCRHGSSSTTRERTGCIDARAWLAKHARPDDGA